MVNGLLIVTKKPVKISLIAVSWSIFLFVVTSILDIILKPRNIIQKAPAKRNTGWLSKVSPEIANSPKTASIPYAKSAKATPKPVYNPAKNPYWRDLLIHITAEAPTGKATKKPIMRPATR